MTSWTCAGFRCDPPIVMFVLYGDGSVTYRSTVDGPVMQAQVDRAGIEELLTVAIGDLGNTPHENTFGAVPAVEFEIQSAALTQDLWILSSLSRLLQDHFPDHDRVRSLAQRLLDFGIDLSDIP